MSHTPFDLQTLSQATGPKVFARGEAYAEQGHVAIVDVEDDAVLAHVEGSETYSVALTPSAGTGNCTCPAFEDWAVCKHLVATAIVYNDLGPAQIRRAHGRIAKLRQGLGLDTREALIERLVDLARRQPQVLAALEGENEA